MKIKCPSWDHVESFYSRKLKGGNTLTMRVPFALEPGADIVLALRLPNDMVMAIDATVTAAKPTSSGQVTAIQLHLHGMTHEVLARLRALVADGRGGHEIGDSEFIGEQTRADAGPPIAHAHQTEPQGPSAPHAVPPPVLQDAPIDEVVKPPAPLDSADVPESMREVFGFLDAELSRLRELGAAEVLGVDWDAEVPEIRRGYFELIRQFHPDLYSAYRSRGIHHLAQEVFIHINRAYDRMRDAAANAGKAVVAGPALMPHRGWLVDFDDLDVDEQMPPPLPATPPVGLAAVTFTTKLPSGLFDDSAIAPLPATAAAEPETHTRAPTASEPLDMAEAVTEWDDALGTRAATVQDKLDAANSKLVEAANLAAEARTLLAGAKHEAARDKLSEALRADPRNRGIRALYHVSRGRILVAEGCGAEATAQFEAALSHDRSCAEAIESLDQLRGSGEKKEGLFRRFFR